MMISNSIVDGKEGIPLGGRGSCYYITSDGSLPLHGFLTSLLRMGCRYEYAVIGGRLLLRILIHGD